MGNMNADISDRNSVFANYIHQFCQDNNLILSSKMLLPVDSYHTCEIWHTTSWLGQSISITDAHAPLGCVRILYGATTSDEVE